MPGAPPSRRRPFNTRGRHSATPKRRTIASEVANFSEPPPKRRRYVPGGPGGGGHYVENDGTETVVGGTGPGGYAYNPRNRSGAQNSNTSTYPASERPRRSSQRERTRVPKPRYSSAAAASAAMVNGDGFKPREERGWEEFHQDLQIETDLPVFSADEVDGLVKSSTPGSSTFPNGVYANGEFGEASADGGAMIGSSGTFAVTEPIVQTPIKRGPGRPPRNRKSMIQGLGTPDTPKHVPPPGPNPREKLTLPKPSFRPVDPFASYEKSSGSIDYVDKSMASVGYQESEMFPQPTHYIRLAESSMEEDLDLNSSIKSDPGSNSSTITTVKRVEYDMDEQDQKFLEEYNKKRKEDDVEGIKPAIFEVTMSFIEKEWHALEKRIPKPNPKPPQTHRPRSSSAAAVNGEAGAQGEEQDSKCAICDDGDCENTNAIVFCDGCDLAVHQECYGVPFIPEGQWLCRKCHLIGSGTPTCIFCPNTDGAFKQTNSSKWSHLLCAIWIPEVSLGNTTFMEPVMDVEKVPKPRWRLTCSICNQKMGACIQCGNKNCFRAFHVTCGRRAKWFLQMKSSHGGPASLDASVLKAYCDKHVPPEWRKNNDVDGATREAMYFYRHAMRGKVWADSQQMAASIQATQKKQETALPSIEDSNPKMISPNKRKKTQPPKNTWKLPSGAPVIPAVVYDAVDALLTRFGVRQRKQYAQDMCRYWTLKREARRGAALIKRLQLQMEMFSSMEITRRDFAAMGAAGGPRLKRRKSFTRLLKDDGDKLKELAQKVMERQQLKVEDDAILDGLLDTVYFPIGPMLRPMVDKALALNGKGFFRDGLVNLKARLEQRHYTSVEPFYRDLAFVFTTVIGSSASAESNDSQVSLASERPSKKEWTPEQKEKLKVARRIMRSIQPTVEDAMIKEGQLLNKQISTEISKIDLLDINLPMSNGTSAAASVAPTVNGSASEKPLRIDGDVSMDLADSIPPNGIKIPHTNGLSNGSPSSSVEKAGDTNSVPKTEPPPTPPLSSSSNSKPAPGNVLAHGGVPQYMQGFEPDGTTISDERWTGRDVARDMSEELSDMDEDDVNGLVDGAMHVDVDGIVLAADKGTKSVPESKPPPKKKAGGNTKRRAKRYR